MSGITGGDLLLEVDELAVSFPTEDGLVQAVRGVSYQLRSGEAFGIVGESGSGKSVTSLAVMGLLPGNARITGSVRLRGQELLDQPDRVLAGLRGRRIAMIFQDPLTSLNPVYPIGRQIAEAITAHHPEVSRQAALDRAVELLDAVGIPHPKERVHAYPHELSGGMRQRVVIAIAMANNPDIIIADEPTTALDVTVQAQVLQALEAAREQTGAALILITHDLGVIAGHAERVGVMYAGRLVETGTVEEIFYAPRMPYTLGLLGSLPRLDLGRAARLTPIVGTPPSLLNLPPGCPFTPRCPLAEAVCEEVEPPLDRVGASGHRAACHFSDRLAGTRASDIFAAVSIDTEELSAADLKPDLMPTSDPSPGALPPGTLPPGALPRADGGPAADPPRVGGRKPAANQPPAAGEPESAATPPGVGESGSVVDLLPGADEGRSARARPVAGESRSVVDGLAVDDEGRSGVSPLTVDDRASAVDGAAADDTERSVASPPGVGESGAVVGLEER